MNFQFLASPVFVNSGSENERGEYADETRKEIAILRSTYPELSHWGDLAIESAWGSYSQDVMMISWVYWKLNERADDFLNYCCWRQTRGKWSWGDDSAKLAQACDWKT